MSTTATENAVKVFVVDDDPFVLKWFVRQLNSIGYTEVTACTSAGEAMNAMAGATGPRTLVFCDLQMPDIDGVEFVRHLVHAGFSGGLVLVSGEDQRILQTAEKLARGRNLNVLGAIKKPATIDQLQRLLGGNWLGAARRDANAAVQTSVICTADELRLALANGELSNQYQPKVEVASGKIAGVETLVRWNHPQHGLVLPEQFVPLAEEHGLIEELTRTVLAAALHDTRLWRNAGLNTNLAVNVSMLNLNDVNFPDYVAGLAGASGVPVDSLMLEITESRLMKDPLSSLDILTRLRLKGIRLSIDDFGTGHSSLANLRDVPFNELKIDRGFVHGAWKDKQLKAIFDASLSLARQLGIVTTAEGVEDRADWNFVRKARCDLAQGNFIGLPMPAKQLPDWLTDWQERDLAT